MYNKINKYKQIYFNLIGGIKDELDSSNNLSISEEKKIEHIDEPKLNDDDDENFLKRITIEPMINPISVEEKNSSDSRIKKYKMEYFIKKLETIIEEIEKIIKQIYKNYPILQDYIIMKKKYTNLNITAFYVTFKKTCSHENIHMTLLPIINRKNYCFHITHQYCMRFNQGDCLYPIEIPNRMVAYFYKKDYLYFNYVWNKINQTLYLIMYKSYNKNKFLVTCKKSHDIIFQENTDDYDLIVLPQDQTFINSIYNEVKKNQYQLNLSEKQAEFETIITTILISLVGVQAIYEFTEINLSDKLSEYIINNLEKINKFISNNNDEVET